MDIKTVKEIKVEHHLNSLLNIVIADPLLNPPFEINGDIISDFKLRCTRYLELISTYKTQHTNGAPNFDELIKKTNTIQKGIQSSLESFLSGDIKSAYDHFDITFSDHSTIQHIHRITEPLSVFCNDNKPLFRVRKSEKSLTSRSEIFHIPFSIRHYVDAQRYSVAGLPCLYLGTSLYVCWQEMNKPDFDKLYISAFTAKETDSKILNFASPHMILPSAIDTNDENRSEMNKVKASYLIFWPLIMACNYTKKDDTAKFIQEYVIPNLLMQWISRKTHSMIVGVAYFSTKIPKSRISYRSINVVFPPKITYEQTIKQNFCPKLSSFFSFTPPVSWQVLKTLDHTAVTENSQELLELRISKGLLKTKEKKEGIDNFEEDLIKLYPLTDFYKLEKSIDLLFQYQSIDNPLF